MAVALVVSVSSSVDSKPLSSTSLSNHSTRSVPSAGTPLRAHTQRSLSYRLVLLSRRQSRFLTCYPRQVGQITRRHSVRCVLPISIAFVLGFRPQYGPAPRAKNDFSCFERRRSEHSASCSSNSLDRICHRRFLRSLVIAVAPAISSRLPSTINGTQTSIDWPPDRPCTVGKDWCAPFQVARVRLHHWAL